MTDRYKQMAMKWLTGKLETLPTLNSVRFNEFDYNNNKLQHLMDDLYFPYGYYIQGVVQGSNSNDEGLEYSVVYGNYQNQTQTQTKGFIAIFDQQYNLIQLIKNYSNGDNFNIIISLNVGSDGRYYMVEYDSQGYYRFVLLNNIIAKSPMQEEYQVIMRNTYRFNNQSLVNTTKMLMVKHPQEAKYLMVQIVNNNVQCTQFTINVGATNEWTYYSTSAGTNTEIELSDILASWDAENNLTFKILTNGYTSPTLYCREFNKASNSNTLTMTKINIETDITSYNNIHYIQSIIKNFNISYFSLSLKDTPYSTYKLYMINIRNTSN